MVEDLRRRLCNDGHEDRFPLFRLSARYWLSDETFVGVHKAMTLGEMRRFRSFAAPHPGDPVRPDPVIPAASRVAPIRSRVEYPQLRLSPLGRGSV
jgi:hypothetical protein